LATITTPFVRVGRARAARRPFYGNRLIVAGLIGQFVSVGVQMYVLGTFLEPMTEDLGWTRSQFTLAGTTAQVVAAAAGFVVGTHVDRHGPRRLMLIGLSIIGVALVAVSFVQELWQWIAIQGLFTATGAAMTGHLVVSVTLSKWFVERRGMAIGWASMGISLGGIVLAPLMTLVIDAWGWRVGWRVLAVIAVSLLLPAALTMRRAPEDHGLFPDGKTAEEIAGVGGDRARADFDASFTRAEALRTRTFYLLVLSFGMFGITNSVMLLQSIPFVTDAGFSRSRAAVLVFTQAIPALLSKPVWGALTARLEPNKLAAIGAAVTSTAMVTITLSTAAGVVPLMFAGFFLLGAGFGGVAPLTEVIWSTYFGRRYIGAVRSAALPFSLALGAGAPLLASAYFDRVGNYDGAFLTIAACNITAAVLLLFVRRPVRPVRPVPAAPVAAASASASASATS
jgi:sugar phosphate permease